MASVKYDPVIGDKGYFPDYTLGTGDVVLNLDQINGAMFYHQASGNNTVTLPPTVTLITELQLAIGQAVSFTLRNTGSSATTSTLTPGDSNTSFGPGSSSQASVVGGSSVAFTLFCVSYIPPLIQIESFAANIDEVTDVTIHADDGTDLTSDTFTISGGSTGLTTTITGTTVEFDSSSLLTVPHGGTGASTLTGVILGNGTSPFTAESPLSVGKGGTGAVTLSGVVLGNGTSAFTAQATLDVAHGGTGAATLTGILTGNGTSAVTGNAVAAHDVLVGGPSNAVVGVGPGTAGLPLLSGGPAADPSYGTLGVGAGGTGVNTLTGVVVGNGTSALSADPVTAYEVVVGGATNNTLTSIPNASAGWALTSNGPGLAPTFQPVSGSSLGAFSADIFSNPTVSGNNLSNAARIKYGGTDWDNTTGIYTFPSTGNYMIFLQLTWSWSVNLLSPSTQAFSNWNIYINATGLNSSFTFPNPSEETTSFHSTVSTVQGWAATAGDTLYVQVNWTAGTDWNVALSGPGCSLSILRVS